MKKALLLGAVLSFPAFAQEVLLKEVEVKGKRETFRDSLEIREVRESFAKDVGEALTRIEGVHKIRKAGIANDVVIRAFQRHNINVLIDDTEVHAACPNRMDPPAFHVDFSEVERIDVVKGPFDIRHQGSLGGLVNIITKKPEQGFRLRLNVTVGSFDYRNFSPVISYRDERFYGLVGYSYRYSKPYKDGDGKRITEVYPPNNPSGYKPNKINSKAFEINTYWTKFGISPTKGHELEFAYTRQEAKHVLYPALLMDAIRDDTDRFNLTYKIEKPFDLIKDLKFQLYHTKVEHDMTDQYRLRSNNPIPGKPYHMRTYAETKNTGFRVEGNLESLLLGFEYYKWNWDARNERRGYRMGTPIPMIPDVDTTNFGVFGEYRTRLGDMARLVVGLRVDSTKTEASDLPIAYPASGDGRVSDLYFTYHGTRKTSKRDTYPSGNVQLFYNLSKELELFAGLGYAVRVPDPQERYIAFPMPINAQQNRCMNPDGIPNFCGWVGNPNLKPSKNLELDLGLKYQDSKTLTRFVAFVSSVKDYITLGRKVVENQTPFVQGAPTNATAQTYVNTDATFWGFEFSSTYNIWNNLFLFGGASYTRGTKDRKPQFGITDRDVAEVPPLRGRLGLRYDTGMWFVEGETVATSTQNKVDSDLKEQKTSGWAIVNLKAGVNYKNLTLNAGVDNVFDKKYFEHLSYTRSPFRAGVRVPEPGRSFYVSASYQF